MASNLVQAQLLPLTFSHEFPASSHTLRLTNPFTNAATFKSLSRQRPGFPPLLSPTPPCPPSEAVHRHHLAPIAHPKRFYECRLCGLCVHVTLIPEGNQSRVGAVFLVCLGLSAIALAAACAVRACSDGPWDGDLLGREQSDPLLGIHGHQRRKPWQHSISDSK